MKLTVKQISELVARGQASIEDMRTMGADLVTALKADEKVRQFRMHASDPLIHKDTVDETRTIKFIASDETVDRMGDIVRVKGWDLKNYKTNPIILWGHDPDSPIGNGKAMKGQTAGGKPALFMDVTFADEGTTELADQTFLLVKSGVLRANSVGFRSIESNRPESAEERQELGLGEFGIEFLKQELFEDSIVSVPANPSAVTAAMRDMVQRSLLTQEQADVFVHRALGEEPNDHFSRNSPSVFDMSDLSSNLKELLEEDADEPDEGDESHAVDDADIDLSALESDDTHSAALIASLVKLIETQTEQLAATRQLADVVGDLARKVLELNAETGARPAAGGESGDEEIDPSELQRALDVLASRVGRAARS